MSILQSTSSDKIIVDKTKRTSASSRVVHDTRHSVNNNSTDHIAYQNERQISYAQYYLNAKYALPGFIILVCLVSANWVGISIATYWALMAICAVGYLITICYSFLKSKQDKATRSYWRKRFIIAQSIFAFVWVFFGLYNCDACGPSQTFPIIQFSTVLVFQALTMLLSYGFGSSLLITSGPVTIVLATRLILVGDPASIIMGAILICSQAFFYLLAHRFRISVLLELAHKAEREGLIAELETTKGMSEEARHRAEEANLAKSRFLATMSHELRTPLNAILGFSEVMKSEVLGPMENETYKGYVTDIHNSGNHLLNVINEILDLSRIEAGRQDLHEEALRLSYVVEEAAHMVKLKAQQKNITLVSNFESNMPMIWADEKAIRQIALNLLSNALKFTPNGGTVSIAVGWTSTGGQYLAITDTGPGIPEEEIPIVLSSFGQGSIAIKSAERGSGLGLPIVQALMDMHDGKFELTSKLRQGTKVLASFPHSRVMEIMDKTENRGQEKHRPDNISGLRKRA